MRRIVYYVAISLDGFIAGPNEDISGFKQTGNGVDKYIDDLKSYDTVIMGRKTYEFGYKYGLKPGQRAYDHMTHYIFSNTLSFDDADQQVHVCTLDVGTIKNLKKEKGTDIYLCGGGEFAGWLFKNQMIDVLKIKLNPFIQGQGVRLFGEVTKSMQLELKETDEYENGLQIMTYDVIH